MDTGPGARNTRAIKSPGKSVIDRTDDGAVNV
jgi:hypothetical protein